MRTNEAISLDDEFVDLEEGIIEIHQTKFGKSRKIPFHASTKEILKEYVRTRDLHYPSRNNSAFFVNSHGCRIDRTAVQRTFRKMCINGDVGTIKGLNPRIMDLRHTFAVRNLLKCFKEDLDVDQVIIALSTYLGHENPECTYGYLTSTPELLSLINLRVEKKYWRK
ncbi:MAG: tyrosine-type recombinase/integrase [Parachlamydiaceae bacterium]|nr:tyrosine-type recombinase/integrase [Parachlamydiaceae bacterium]